MSGGALSAVLGMLRSPTGRPAAVAFLRVVSALLEGVPAPADFFSGHLAIHDGGLGGEVRGGEGGGEAPAEDDRRYVRSRGLLFCVEGNLVFL